MWRWREDQSCIQKISAWCQCRWCLAKQTHLEPTLKWAGNGPTSFSSSSFPRRGEREPRGRVLACSKQRRECLTSWERTRVPFFPFREFYRSKTYLYNLPKAWQHLNQSEGICGSYWRGEGGVGSYRAERIDPFCGTQKAGKSPPQNQSPPASSSQCLCEKFKSRS